MLPEQIYALNLDKIAKIQAVIRGYLDRFRLKLMEKKEETVKKECAILVARSFYIIEESHIYILLIYVDEVFTKLTIRAIKFEPHQPDRSKIETFEIHQKLKSFLSLLMLKFYSNIMVDKIELRRRNMKILVVSPNIEEIITEYSSKIGTTDDNNLENMKTHISVKRKKQFRKALRLQFTHNVVSPNY